MPSPDRQPAEWQGSEPKPSHPTREEGSTTPRRPSFSPVTPTISLTSLVSGDHPARPVPEWIDEPEPLPVSLEDNSDAIALRAAISILQLQRQQSLRDIRALDKMKAAALQQPEKFVEDLKAGKLTTSDPVAILDVDDSDDDTTDDITNANVSQFGKFPNAQNVVRAPPINWDKYHVVGESLDKLHEQQRKRPGADESAEEHMRLQPEHAIAAPYGPFVDKLEPLPATSTH
jgi:hypothetical protein